MRLAPDDRIVWQGVMVPTAVVQFGNHIHPAMDAYGEQWLEGLRELTNEAQKPEIAKFLRDALNGRYSNAELKGLLNQIAPNIIWGGAKNVRDFLERLADAMLKEART